MMAIHFEESCTNRANKLSHSFPTAKQSPPKEPYSTSVPSQDPGIYPERKACPSWPSLQQSHLVCFLLGLYPQQQLCLLLFYYHSDGDISNRINIRRNSKFINSTQILSRKSSFTFSQMYGTIIIQLVFTALAPRPAQSISLDVWVSVCLCVCPPNNFSLNRPKAHLVYELSRLFLCLSF